MLHKRKNIAFGGLTVIIIIFFLFFPWPPLKGEAILTWNASTDKNAAGYKIYFGTVKRNNSCPAGGYEENIDVGNVVKFKIANLQNKKKYYFSVTSYNAAKKESCFSEEREKFINNSFFSRLVEKLKRQDNIPDQSSI